MGWAHDAAHQCHVAAAHILRSERCLAPLPWGHSDLMSSIIIRRGYPGGCPSQGFGAYSTKWSWEGSVGRKGAVRNGLCDPGHEAAIRMVGGGGGGESLRMWV